MGRIARAALVALAAAGVLGGCKGRGRAGDGGPATAIAPEFIDATFEQMYPIFLQHKIGQGPKAALWQQHYYRRWVRWTGRIRSFSANGVTLRQLPITSTFDVSLWINNEERAAVRARYKVGDVVVYVGRFDSYDDIWRTLYLVNGSILGRAAAQDAGF